ncbi:hypothetical protein [Streptomyces showdoensis]|uniref:hypothetical protein n=1 Tax=Streptomyces showdoensis TaxID=68268 RepID=UPI000F4EB28F|nr:hypothetical protein [Streptomyces showdoensis]
MSVDLRVDVFQKGPGGLFWEWVPAHDVPARRIAVATDGELAAALALHGPRVAGLLEECEELMWRISAHHLPTGDVVAQWYWQRSEETGRWIPNSEPWVVLDDRARIAALHRARRLADRRDQGAA